MNCPRCGYENPDDALECVDCGVIFSRIAVPELAPPGTDEGEARRHITGPGNGETEKGGIGVGAQPQDPGPRIGEPVYRIIGESAKSYGARARSVEEASDSATPLEIAGVLLLGDEQDVNPFHFWGRVAAFVLILLYSWTFITFPLGPNEGYSFLHNVDLAFHEAGHIIFMPFGRFITVLGGSLMQVLVPSIFTIAFLLYYRNPFAASVTFWWVGQNFVDVAPYIFDARNRQLILLGGITGRENSTIHDWYNILSQLDLLRFDHAIAKGAKGIGIAIIFASLVWGGWVLVKQWRRISRTQDAVRSEVKELRM